MSLLTVSALMALLAGAYTHANISFSDLAHKSEAELRLMLVEAVAEDQGRVHVLLGRTTMDRDPAISRKHLQTADALVTQDDLAGRAYLAASWCWLDLMFADLSKARQKCERSVEIADQSGDNWAITKAYTTMAGLHYQVGELRSADDFGRKALAAAIEVGSAELIATQHNTMGLITRAQGMFQRGLDYFASGLELIDLDNHEELYRIMSFNVGIAHADLGQHEIAQDFYRGSLQWAVENQRYAKELTALVYYAMSDNALGKHQDVVRTLSAAIIRPELRENNGYLAFAYAILGEAHLALGELDLALQEYELGMRIIATDPNTFEQRRVKTGYGRVLFATGAVDQAREIVTDTISQLRNENSRTALYDALDLLVELEESVGNYAASLTANKEATSLAREFQQQSFEHELATIRGDYELDEKDRALAKAQQDTIVRNGLILLVIAFGFIGYLGMSRRTQRQRAEAEAQHAELLEIVVFERTRELEEKIEQTNIAESARIALERQLSEAEKLRVLGQLTGGVAHDFNNLLTVVIGAADLLKATLPVDQSNNELIQHIITAAATGADITRALMAYARKQPLELETVVLNDVLRERVPLIARTLGGMVHVHLDIQGCPQLDAVLDRSQLTSAILNLCLNARDAQDARGDIYISLEPREGRWAVISVADTGCGMTADEIQRAAEPFYTTKDDAHGTGLGLSMVYGFSKQLGGDLEIESEVGVGTVMRLVFPLAHLADSRVYEVDFGQGKS